ncbi:MAG: SDR family oxidoreductase [Lacinutrix sp.]|uniref:SDR family NAD(P)-dependent oxidoreductase n=1 Tax=Lacinutrix sp. TaxID=1937692 RepID=UPI00309FB534
MIDITDKNAFITGSSRGIGQQIAIGLANLGCNIIIHGRTQQGCNKTQSLLSKFSINTYCVYGELSNENDVKHLIKQIENLNIKIDILYNNAGIMTPYKTDYLQHSGEDWMLSMKVNVFSVYSLCSAFIPLMLENKFGRIINVISGIKHEPELAPYGASKWALIKLTDDFAVKLKDTNVRINTLDPGWLRTDLGGEYADHPVEAVLPGALAPALIENNGPNGESFLAINK